MTTTQKDADDTSNKYDWRQEEPNNVSSLKQHGVNPSRFHHQSDNDMSPARRLVGSRRRRQRQEKEQHLVQVLSQARSNVIREKKKQVSVQLSLQRSAYKDVTSLRTWPLQGMAMCDLEQLKRSGNAQESSSTGITTQTQQASLSSSSSSSSASSLLEEEPKRTKSLSPCQQNEEPLSPRKSTLRSQFQHEFLRERDIPLVDYTANADRNVDCSNQQETDIKKEATVLSVDTSQNFLPALWCMEPRIFAMEKNGSGGGKRKYMVGQFGRFCDRYWRKCDAKHRHYYELIQQGQACRLYLDLEYSKAANPDLSTNIAQDLLKELFAEIQKQFDLVFSISNVTPSCLVDLDSSTDTKFSRHWIFHLPSHALFANSIQVGHFVKNLIGRLASDAGTGTLGQERPTLQKYLFVNTNKKKKQHPKATNPVDNVSSNEANVDKTTNPVDNVSYNEANDDKHQEEQPKTCFVDLGVYTKNRLFRLLGSTKCGKPPSAALRIASSNQFPFPEGFTNDCFYVPDMEQRKNKSEEVDKENEGQNQNENPAVDDEVDSDMTKFMSSVDWTKHSEALAATLVVPMNVSKIQLPILPEITLSGVKTGKSIFLQGKTTTANQRVSFVSANGVESSPFPQLDDFVTNVLGARGGVEGAIRVWSLDGICNNDMDNTTPRSITYQMCRNRYCERIGRAHKSNNIMWIVDLQLMTCVQSCHDPDCRMMQFRGTPVSVPPPLCDHIRDVLFELELATMDEATLLQQQQDGGDDASLPKQDKQQALDDDAEFEKALLNLNISDKEHNKSEDDVNGAVPPSQTTPFKNGKPEDLLDDSTLLDAVLTNPELFP